MFGHALAKLTSLMSLDVSVTKQALNFENPPAGVRWTGGALGQLSQLTSLTRLAVTVVDERIMDASEARRVCTLLSGTLGSLPHLQEICAEIKLDTHLPCPPELAELVNRAGEHPAMRLIELCFRFQADTAQVLLPVLLPLAARKFPVLALRVHIDIVKSSPSLVPLLPLLPSVQNLTVDVHARPRDLSGKLEPLVEAVPELTAVTRVQIEAYEVPAGGCVQRLIDAVASLTTLRSLEVGNRSKLRPREDDQDVDDQESEDDGWQFQGDPNGVAPVSELAMARLACLTGLTALEFAILSDFTYMEGFARSCGALTKLRKLTIRVAMEDGEDEIIQALSKLHLLTLNIGAGLHHKDLVRGLIPALPHLRTVNFFEAGSEAGLRARELSDLIDPLLACRNSFTQN